MWGVTARTLWHYDEVGLLPPARIGANGHRYYEEHQLLRLQQILARQIVESTLIFQVMSPAASARACSRVSSSGRVPSRCQRRKSP